MLMSKRLDALFSVERLRETWAGKTPGSAQPATEDQHIEAIPGVTVMLGEVVRLVRLRFPGTKGRAFEPLLSELEEKVMSRFPNDPDRSVPEEERDALNLAIDGLLSRIENLAEALELAQRRKLSTDRQR